MTIDPTKLAKVKTAMDNRYENKQSNKKNDISGDYTSDTASYPTVQAVKTYVSGQGYLTSHQDISGKEDSSNKVTSWSGTTSDTRYPSEKLVKDSLDNKANSSAIPTKVSDLTNDSGFLTSHQSLDSKTVTVEKQSTAESGYIATYVIKQGGTALSPKINIPKDYLVKSASMGTCSTADTPVTGYVVGDKYLDFVINTKDNSGTDEHLYILVSDLIDTYTADNSTLQVSNNQFSVKNGGIGTTQLASGVVTSLGYADTFHSSPAAGITSTQVSNWDAIASSGVASGDIDDRINQALDDLAELIYPTSNS